MSYVKYKNSANIFQVTITRTRPDTSTVWFDDALASNGEKIDITYNDSMISYGNTSSDNLVRTTIKTSDTRSNLESYLTDLNDPNSVYHGITAYNTSKGIIATISDIIEIQNPDYYPF